jgi:hypothetical protein
MAGPQETMTPQSRLFSGLGQECERVPKRHPIDSRWTRDSGSRATITSSTADGAGQLRSLMPSAEPLAIERDAKRQHLSGRMLFIVTR